MEQVIFIVGPTAVGKTQFTIELAKKISGEIISADSMQAYRSMDIISQKPAPAERKKAAHHLIDILDVSEEYSAAEFARRASALCDKITASRKTPIVAGGSGLYIKALIDGLFRAPRKDVEFRKALERESSGDGSAALHGRLRDIDPEAASKIHKNDLRRIIRALEIFHLTGRTISEHKKETKGLKDRFDIRIYGLIRPREALYRRAEERVDRMFEEGLVKEVILLRRAGSGITAAASLGYKEVCGYLDKEYPLEEAKRLLKMNTRRFIKKQLTWFSADKRIEWIDIEKTPQGEAVDMIEKWRKRSA